LAECEFKASNIVDRRGAFDITNSPSATKLEAVFVISQCYNKKEKYPIERAKEFYNIVIPLSKLLNDMAGKINEIRDQFDTEFRAKGIDISKPFQT